MYMPQVTLPALSISLLSISGTLLSLLHITLYSLSAPLLTLSYTLLSLRPNTLAPLYSIICLCLNFSLAMFA